ncbi:MAG TPA: S8 family serine peptidase [Pyrinomonadaceae bacterium]|nr:S8 family serine peptidase [Pyrinomonadaceae bacterium]
MSTSHFSNSFSTSKTRVLLSVVSITVVGLLIAAVLIFPSHSRAQLETVQQATASKKPRRPTYVPGDVIVRYKSESMAAHRTGALRLTAKTGQLLSMKVENFDGSELLPGLRVVRVNEADTLTAISALRAQPDVLYAEPNYIMHADVTPNDPQFVAGRQSSMNTIGAPQAWNTKTGDASVVVGVIDQGIDTNHQDLAANIWTNPTPGAVGGITGDVHGYNFVDNNGTLFTGADTETHATHVAGILGAVGNNGKGVAGVSWSVGLMSLKFLDSDGFGDSVDAIRACNYAKQMRTLWVGDHSKGANIRVLNASFGGAGFTNAFLQAINELNDAGILFVAAAGNTTDDGTREPDNDLVPHYPSSFDVPNVIAVAATDQSDNFASTFSHFGSASVDLAAPGDTILSTTPHCSNPGPLPKPCEPAFTDANGDTYTFFSGTSMSTPHVSGAAALLWAQNPNLTVAQVKNLLMFNGDVRPSLIDKTLTGRRLNVGNSFQSLAENDTIAPGAVTNFHINSQNGRTINVGWTASGDDGAAGQAALYQLTFTDGSTVIPLKGLVPMPSGSGQIATVTIPYRHTSGTLSLLEFDNVGNAGTPVTLPIGIPQSVGDPYTTLTGSGPSPALSTDATTNVGPTADDQYNDVLFPAGFTFPFFGTTYTEVTISSNGALYFGTPPPTRDNGDADDVPSSPGKLGGYRAIAGLWDDLDLRVSSRADAGVYQVASPGKVIYRFQGVPCEFDGNVCTGTTPVNFEIELNSNGVIKTRYGSGNVALFPTVGIGGGGQQAYVITTHTNEQDPLSLTNAPEVTFTPRAQTVSTIQLSASTFKADENIGSLQVNVTRTGDLTSVATVNFATSDTSGLAGCATTAGSASSRSDYLTSAGSLKFAAGETQKTVSIPIIDDVYAEGAETFTITLSNPTGATLGATTVETLTIIDNDGGTNGTANPLNTPAFYVRQHYVDFLNREPDASGLAFWISNFTQCGSDAQCIEVKRINVSGAFFLSIEFQQTGYLVERIYKTAFGDFQGTSTIGGTHTLSVPIVTFNEFLPDTQKISEGVQVGIGDWQGQLEANKQAFTLAFVQQPRFLAAFPNSMTATDIVNQMTSHAGITPSPSETASLINLLGVTPADVSRRAAVLRAVAEDQRLQTAEFNKAFVLMQYFGYLRRSPNDAPDTNHNGYEFWLGKLNDFHGDFVQAEMVKAFLDSTEYNRRFLFIP